MEKEFGGQIEVCAHVHGVISTLADVIGRTLPAGLCCSTECQSQLTRQFLYARLMLHLKEINRFLILLCFSRCIGDVTKPAESFQALGEDA